MEMNERQGLGPKQANWLKSCRQFIVLLSAVTLAGCFTFTNQIISEAEYSDVLHT